MSNFRPKIELLSSLGALDWSVFAICLLITVLAIIYGQHLKKKKDIDKSEAKNFLDLLIMGRALTLPLFVSTLVATWYGAIIPVTENAFKHGIYNFITQGAFWYVSYLVFAFFIIDKVTHYKAVTLPDLIGKMFGPRSAYISGIFNFFNVLPISYAIGIGLFIQMIYPLPLLTAVTIGVGLVIAYSFLGGFRAVVFSDVVQFFVMCLSVLLVLIFSISQFGGMEFLKSELPAKYFTATSDKGLMPMFVWGFIAMATLVDPNFYQRCFAAESAKTAKKGIIISTMIWFCFDICTTFGAMYAKAVIPKAESSKAYIYYALQILPDGFKGFFLAGIIAIIFSTLDSYIFLAGTTLAYDLAPKKYKGKVRIHHIGVIVAGIGAILMSTLFKGDIKQVWKTIGSYYASCLLLPVVWGYLFPKNISDNQFISGCISGIVGTSIWKTLQYNGHCKEIPALYLGLISTFIGLIGFSFYRTYLKSPALK